MKKYLDKDIIIKIIKNYPLIEQKKEFFKEILDIFNTLIDAKDNMKEEELLYFLNCLISLYLYKKNIRCCFLYSTCLNQSLMKDLVTVKIIF
jgi:hypothetical protein